MTKARAKKLADDLTKYCRENEIWHEETRESRPKLGKITIVISIKIDEK